MKPRVLIYRSDVLPPSETFIAEQARALQSYQAVFLGLRASRPSLPLDGEVILPRYAAGVQRLLVLECGAGGALLRRTRKAGPCLIHAHFSLDGTEALPLAQRLALPLVVTLHGYDVMRADRAHAATRRGRRYLARRAELSDYAHAFICVSEAIRRSALLRGFPEHKLHVLPIGIDPERYTLRLHVPPEPTILFVGRLVSKKGCDTLIAAMRLLQHQQPGARLVIVGDGPDRSRLEALARLQTEGTQFLGRQTPQQVQQLLSTARCLAAPSRTAADGDAEGLPTVLLEAMAAGVPVASTVHSGIPELVQHGETGLLCPEGNVEMLARNLLRLCTEDALAARLAAAGRTQVEQQFALAAQTSLLESLYDEAVAAGKRFGEAGALNVQGHSGGAAGSTSNIAARQQQPRLQSVVHGVKSFALRILQKPRNPLGDPEDAAVGGPQVQGTVRFFPGGIAEEPPAAGHAPRLRAQAAWLLSGNGASMLFQAFAFVLVGRMLGSRGYGAFVGAVALVNVLSQFSSLGMEMVLLRTVSRDPEAFAATWFRALVISGAGFLCLLVVVLTYGHFFLPPEVRSLLPLLACADALFGKVTQLGSRALQGAGMVRWSAKLLAATNVARCAAATLLVIASARRHAPVTLAAWAHWYVAASAAVACFSGWMVTRLLGKPTRAPVRGKHLLEGLSFSFSNSAISIYNDIDKTVLLGCGMLYSAGIYGAAYRVIDVASAPIVSLFGAASPGLFRAGAQGGVAAARTGAERLVRWAAPGGLVIACALALVAPVMPRLFGHSFEGSVNVVRWLSLLPLLRGLHYAWGTAITACASQWLRTAAQAGVALMNLGLNLWLVPTWGWRAAATVSLISDGTLALLTLLILRILSARAVRPSEPDPHLRGRASTA